MGDVHRHGRVASETVSVPGPAGALEAISESAVDTARAIAVVCHPHPLHQGTMSNKVVYTLARAFARLGAAALRFNFRGVGRSAGAYDEGRGERDDAIAVVDWASGRFGKLPLYLAGFSFGAAVALQAAYARRPQGLVTVAPPVARMDARAEHPGCPWLVIQGSDDDIVAADEVRAWAQGPDPRPELCMIAGASHFFHGRLGEIDTAVSSFFGPQFRAGAQS